ncbi:MAG TPA: YoaK family protein [Acidobacteriaceae bacterium]|jgi:uncharacterized membrane protein YoaK (UPF0700 family)
MLAIASGSADGWSYFGLAHAFVANMTGNTVLLGIAVFQSHGDMLHPLVSIAGYFAGVCLGTLIARRVPTGETWARSISWALFLESLFLLAAETVWVAVHQHPSAALGSILLACVALAIGVQSAAMVQLKIPGVVTTYITGTWTTLANGLTLLAARQPQIEREKTKFEERFALQAVVLAVYFLSAVLTGWSFRHAPAVVGAISAVAVLLVAAYGALRG